MENVEDKARQISELYKEKSEILRALSNLNNPDYSFSIGYKANTRWAISYDGAIPYSNLEEDFTNKVKEMTIEQYNRSLEKIENELNDLLKCN